MAQYENKGDRLNILLADELPEDMTGTQDTQHICGKCAWYSFAKLESICRKTGKEVAYFANKECFTTDKDMDMEENNNAQPVAESTGTQVCKDCGRTLPLEEFQRRRYGKRDKVCKACRAEKIRIGIARKKAVKVENPGLVVTSEEVANAKRVYIAQLSRYLTDFKMAGLALWGMLPGKEEDIDQIIKAEWAVPFCREIFAAAAELKRDGANVVPAIVSRRLGSIGRTFVEALGNAFYPLAEECDTSEQTIKEQKEQKPSSKFRSGDWVVYDGPLGHAILQVKEVVDGRYTFVNNDSTLLVKDSDEFLRPLTPKDVERPAESRKRNKPKESWLSKAKYEIEHADELLRQSQEELKEIRELKKQEQKPICDIASDDAIESCMLRYLQSAANRKDDIEIIEDTKAYKSELISIIKKEQKPVEWSEEDTEMYINVASSLRGYACWLENEEHKRHIQNGLDWLENRFKSLRPSWKPSEEQMSMLLAVINDPNNAGAESCYMALKSIYNNLKKL